MKRMLFLVTVGMINIFAATYGWVRAFEVALPITTHSPWAVHGIFSSMIVLGGAVIWYAIEEYNRSRRVGERV